MLRLFFKILFSPVGAAFLVQSILVGLLAFKRMWRRFPLFFSYSVSNLLLALVSYAIYLSPLSKHVYFDAYWTTEYVGLFLGFAVVYEIFRNLVGPYPALRRLATQIFCGTLILLIVIGFAVAYAQSVGERSPIYGVFLVMEQAGRILEVGLLLFLFLFASAFGLHWRQYVFGIALGLGVFVTVELVAVTLRAQFGVAAHSIFNMARMVSFNTSMVIWISYVLAPELATSPTEVLKRAQLEQWNRAVMELIYQ